MPEEAERVGPGRRREAVAAWIRSARGDLASAESLARHRDEGTSAAAAAFHAQQAAEKALKALLLHHAIAFPARHDLSLLVTRLPYEAFEDAVADLTKYAVEQRYPASAQDPMELTADVTWSEVDGAVDTAREVLRAVEDRVSEPTTPVRPLGAPER